VRVCVGAFKGDSEAYRSLSFAFLCVHVVVLRWRGDRSVDGDRRPTVRAVSR
jgi:hypothetical protein